MTLRIHVRYFAAAREAAEKTDETVAAGDSVRVADVLDRLRDRHPALGKVLEQSRVAVNRTICELDRTLVDGDEIAILPPVGGG